MNIPTLTWFDARSWKTIPAKYAVRTTLGGAAFGGLASLVGLSFFGAFAFAAVLIGSHVVLVDEPTAWRAEKVAGRAGILNQTLSIASATVPFVLALAAWLIA